MKKKLLIGTAISALVASSVAYAISSNPRAKKK